MALQGVLCHAQEPAQGRKRIPKDECALLLMESPKQQGLTGIGARNA